MLYIIIILLILLLVLLILTFFNKPNKKRSTSKIFTEYKYAHRGLFSNQDGIPENSLLAFKRAKENEFGVELDVQLTYDKTAVVFHDGNLKRMCGVDKKVWELTYAQLNEYTLKGTQEIIPLFTDVLDLLEDTPIICEIKSYSKNNDLTVCKIASDIINEHNCRLCIESFNPLTIRYFHKNNPDIVRGQLSMDFFKSNAGIGFLISFALKNLFFNFLTKPDFIAYRHTDNKCFWFNFCKKIYNPLTFAWTITSQDEENNALEYLFDTVIFEGYIPK